MRKPDHDMDRRAFIVNGLTAAAGVAAAPLLRGDTKPQKPDPSKTILNFHPDMKYRRVGNTDAHLSVLCMGMFAVTDSILKYALDHGVNCFHVCLNYMEGVSIRAFGKLIKSRRESVYVCLKDEFDHIDDALSALDSDYVDFLMFNRHGKPVATDPKIQDMFEKYRAQGKVRYAGLTSHGDVKNATGAGIESGMYRLVMPLLSPANFIAMAPELDLARKKGVGVMAMKYSWGLKDMPSELEQFKRILTHPGVTAGIRGIRSFEDIVPYIKAAQESPSAAAGSGPQPRFAAAGCMACDACRRACPRGVDVPTLVRCHQYYHQKLDDPVRIAETLKPLRPESTDVSACGSCSLCEAACPNGVASPGLLREARRSLGLA
jgi:predicted aldo/keto reductase-like oxidoreductase